MTNDMATIPGDQEVPPISDEAIEHISRSVRPLPLAEQLKTTAFSSEDKEKFEKAFQFFNTVPKIRDIQVHYHQRRELLRSQLKDLDEKEIETIELARTFWEGFRSNQGRKLSATILASRARPRKTWTSKRPRWV